MLVLSACMDRPSAIPRSQLGDGIHAAHDELAGSELARRSASDSTLREWLTQEGTPDYVILESKRALMLFYVEQDLSARFERAPFSRNSSPPTTGTIRAPDHRFFSNRDRQRLGDLRRERAQADTHPTRSRLRRPANPSSTEDIPASPAR